MINALCISSSLSHDKLISVYENNFGKVFKITFSNVNIDKDNVIPLKTRLNLNMSADVYNEYLFQELCSIIKKFDIKCLLPISTLDSFALVISKIFDVFPFLKGITGFGFANKQIYMKSLKENNILVPTTFNVIEKDSLIDPNINYPDVNYPVICKPSLGTGSIGTMYIKNKKELEDFFSINNNKPNNKLLEFKRRYKDGYRNVQYENFGGNYIIQEYIEGDLVSLGGIICNNEVKIDYLYDIFTTPLPYFAEIKNIYPSKYNFKLKEITKICENICKTLNHNNIPFMVDLIINKENIYVIDYSPRMSGHGNKLVNHIYGNEYYKNVFNTILNCEYKELFPIKKTILFHFFPFKEGKIDEIKIEWDKIDADEFECNIQPNDYLYTMRNDSYINKRGYGIFIGDNLIELEQRFMKTFNSIKVKYGN